MYTQVSNGLQTVSECFSKRLLENQDKYPCIGINVLATVGLVSLASVARAHTYTLMCTHKYSKHRDTHMGTWAVGITS